MSSTKIVLVTGGNNGIGYETVKAFLQSAKAVYHVLLGSRSTERGNKAIEKLRGELPETNSTVELVQLDVTSDESIRRALEQVRIHQGRLDALVSNAGKVIRIFVSTLRVPFLTI